MENSKVFSMKFAKVYDLLVQKAQRKNRTRQEVDEIICWMTGYGEEEIGRLRESGVEYAAFFEGAPCMNPNCSLVTGKVCGITVEEIADPMMRKIRILDKLVDELAKGKKMENILRG